MSIADRFCKTFPDAGARIKLDELMSYHTTFRIGGPADVFFEPASKNEIKRAIRFCHEHSINCTILGRGSNILVSDKGIRGVVLSIADCFSDVSIRQDHNNDYLFYAHAGAKLTSLSALAAQKSCSGLEFASGIPGTIGGAILMNAGAYEGCMSDVVEQTEYLDQEGKIHKINKQGHNFSYRDSFFSNKCAIILLSVLRLSAGSQEKIIERMSELNKRRQTSQPLDLPSAGSAFKRPKDNYAGKLIADSGMQGYRIGDAQVSTKHAGFIVNLGSASASEVKQLFDTVQNTVSKKTGIFLCPEVRFIGDW